ncbi:hypothetical protein BGZ49_005541 [Haplosporangium sp. Z 27]|nr:hypothetical protein BGZ49_005541 [Haplosporangium sp. Z 27]
MPATWSPTPLIPPFRFGTVEPEVYRGAYPKQRNLRFLKRLKLRTILSLVPDAPDAIFQEFCSQQGIRTIHLPVDKVKDNVPLTYNRAVEAVQIIIDQENLPIYIHCLDGASVTGLVVCCLRKLQTWNISSAMGEFLRYLRGGVISSEESVFVEKFSSEIEISKPIPLWLWEGQATFKKHPTLKLKFTIPPAAAAASNANNASITSPTLTTQNVLSTSPSHHGDGTNHNNNDTAITNGDSSAPGTANGDSAVLGNSLNSNLPGSGQSGANSGSSASSSSGLQSHANRTLAKGSPLRDRITNSKTLVRTDISAFPGRTNSIATPTMAALSRNKRTLGPGNAGALGQQQHQLLSEEPVSSDTAAPAAETGAKPINPVQASVPSGSGQSASETGEQSIAPHVISIVRNRRGSVSIQSGDHGLGTNTDANTEKESTAQGTEENTTGNSTLGAQDRNPNTSTVSKNSTTVTPSPVPVPVTEVADEYYEVSMTLKALALEGADF